jgi:hypothetical protein
MIPTAINSDYPIFVPNQVLTSDNLNDLFGYLDEQQRITRTNLVGIGIVCGLHVKTGSDANGSFITITKGTGVTSCGHLVTIPKTKYHHYNQFDAVKPQYYERFVNIGDKSQKMPLWELKQLGEFEDKDNLFHPLNDPAAFLNDKIVLLFVELLETANKNCDPASCDDKGVMVTVNFRPLLALKSDVDTFLNYSKPSVKNIAISLHELKLPRYDVEATLLLDSEDVFHAYQAILTGPFIKSVRDALSEAWNKLNPLLNDEFLSDPFIGLDSKFAFLYDGSINNDQAINLQYFYDFFSDLVAAYDELKRKAFEVVCECVPDKNLFPRHLLLGEAVGFDEMSSLYRTRFIPSPALCCGAEDAGSVKMLFRRLSLLIENFSLTEKDFEKFRKKGAAIRITPSVLGKEPLSAKAIPFYYQPNEGSRPLYLSWDPDRTARGTAHQILSYHSGDYNTSDDFVKHPLKYDLEPNNFLRVEGHIGQDYRNVLANLDKQKKAARLPVDVIALSSDTRSIINLIRALDNMDSAGGIAAAFAILLKHPSCFADLFLALDQWINKLRCCLLESRGYFNRLPAFRTGAAGAILAKRLSVNEGASGDAGPETEDTIGKLYEEKLKDGSINDKFCGDVFVEIATKKSHHAAALVMMPYKIDGMISILPEHITQLDAKVLEAKYADMTGTTAQLRTMYASPEVAGTMTGVDMALLSSKLDMSCLVCLFLELRLLIREFLLRLLGLMIRQKLGFYAYTNPGIQHKAGVTMGGTFILVYHEAAETRTAESRKEFIGTFKNVKMKDGQTAASLFSGDQPMLSSFLLLEEILFLQKVAATENEPNEALDNIVAEIQPGTVIADFYLPYLCTSNCAPSQMVVLPAPETPETPDKPPVAIAKANPAALTISPNQPGTVELNGEDSTDPEGKPLTFNWSVPATQTGISIQDASAAVTTAIITTAGTYNITLTVRDEAGNEASDTVAVAVTMEEPVVKTCGPLDGIIKEFAEWNKLVRKNPAFKEVFRSYGQVLEYFKALNEIVGEPVEKQIDFFAAGFQGSSTPDLFLNWLSSLQPLILDSKEFRLISLMLYRILNLLAMYIVCIQDADFNKAKVPMIAVFDLIRSHAAEWVNMIHQGAFTDEDIAVVKAIANDIENEIKRVQENGEKDKKKNYLKFLKEILSILESI